MQTAPWGIVCSLQDYERSRRDQSISCLTRDDSIGLTVTVEAGLVSLLAILYVFFLTGWNVRWRIRHMSTARLRIFHRPMDILIFSLLLADTIQGIGMVLSIKWVRNGKVEVGSFCTAQGLIKIFGATGVALSSLMIAIYTFIGAWRMNSISSMRITTAVVIGIWASIGTLVLVALATNNDSSLMGPVPYWCWVNSHHLKWRLLGEYLWMWITLFLSLLIYIPLYLWMRGYINLGCAWHVSFPTKQYDSSAPTKRCRSLVMLAYPMAYCISIMPLSVVRWITFVQQARYNGENHMPAAATIAAVSIFGLSGFFNVILLLTTKPESGLFGRLMFVSPAQPPLISDPYRDEWSMEPDFGLRKFPSEPGPMQSNESGHSLSVQIL